MGATGSRGRTWGLPVYTPHLNRCLLLHLNRDHIGLQKQVSDVSMCVFAIITQVPVCV